MYHTVLFVVLIFSVAYILKSVKVFREEDSKVFIDYVIYFSLPSLVFQKIRELSLSKESTGVVLVAWVVILSSMAVSFALGRLLRLEERSLRAFILVSSFGNTAFLGYPFTFAIFGEEGLRYAVLYDQLGSSLLVVSIGFLVATGEISLRKTLLFPPFLALIGGFLMRGIEIPEALNIFLDVSGMSLIPTVLFSIGLKFSPRYILRSTGATPLSLLIKMLLAPLEVLLFMKLLGLGSLPFKVALLETSMPPMVMAGVLAVKYGLDERLAISAITLGILLSFITVPLFTALI